MSLDIELVSFVDVGAEEPQRVVWWEYNITHNLAEMAKAAALYKPMWRPEEVNGYLAKDILVALKMGIGWLERLGPEEGRKLAPSNGWGTYEDLLTAAKEYLKACKSFPLARIWVSR